MEKPLRSTDCGLQLVHMKPEPMVIVHQNGTVTVIWVLYLPPVSVGVLCGYEAGILLSDQR